MYLGSSFVVENGHDHHEGNLRRPVTIYKWLTKPIWTRNAHPGHCLLLIAYWTTLVSPLHVAYPFPHTRKLSFLVWPHLGDYFGLYKPQVSSVLSRIFSTSIYPSTAPCGWELKYQLTHAHSHELKWRPILVPGHHCLHWHQFRCMWSRLRLDLTNREIELFMPETKLTC